MPRRSLALLGALVWLGTSGALWVGCGNSSSNNLSTSRALLYFPIHAGDTWNYQDTHSDGSVHTAQQTVGAAQTSGFNSTYAVTQSEDGVQLTSLTTEPSEQYGGIRLLETDSLAPAQATNVFNPPLLLPDTLIPGVTDNQRTAVVGTGAGQAAASATLSTTLVDMESVTVPAGTFNNCAKVTTTQQVLDASGKPISYGHGSTRTTWLAPGVGVVKVTNDLGETLVLTSATVNGTKIGG